MSRAQETRAHRTAAARPVLGLPDARGGNAGLHSPRPPLEGERDGVRPVARIALVIIAAVLVIFLILGLVGYPFHVKVNKDRGGKGGGGHQGPKVTHSANP